MRLANAKISILETEGVNHLADLKSGKYKKNTGWLNPKIDLSDIKRTSNEIREESDVLVVIGIGGSYLGSKAVIEALSPKFNREMEIIYIGNSLSPVDMKETLEYLETKDFSVNVISKSGGTLEPALAFHFIEQALIKKYGMKNAMERLVITTDSNSGVLRKYAEENGVKSFSIPEDVGGRFSVLTAVGLLPIAVAGIDIERLVEGAELASETLLGEINKMNEAVQYSAHRNYQISQGAEIEILAVHEPRMSSFGEWWKQLFGESEGKDGKGLFPASAVFSTDLHSLGQLIQEGKRNLIETHLVVGKSIDSPIIKNPRETLKQYEEMSLEHINQKSYEGTFKAHLEGGVHSFSLEMSALDAHSVGYYIYFFMLSCSISALTLGVNPFDQPGVEMYKRNIKKLLSK